jgi:hypothetical protein
MANVKFNVKVNMDGIKTKLAAAIPRAEHILAEQMRKDTAPYVPMSGNAAGLDNRTRVEDNEIIYPGPYARYLYYGKVMVDPETGSPWAKAGATKVVTDRNLVFTQTHHSDAQAFWCEASKAQNKDKWERVAQKAIDHILKHSGG